MPFCDFRVIFAFRKSITERAWCQLSQNIAIMNCLGSVRRDIPHYFRLFVRIDQGWLRHTDGWFYFVICWQSTDLIYLTFVLFVDRLQHWAVLICMQLSLQSLVLLFPLLLHTQRWSIYRRCSTNEPICASATCCSPFPAVLPWKLPVSKPKYIILKHYTTVTGYRKNI